MSSKQVKSDIVSNQDVITLSSQLDAMNRLYDISTLFIHKDNWSQVLTKIVETAIAISGADFGNIQLLDDNSSRLNIVAHYGFPKWWLDFWNEVHKGEGVCGTALETGKRVIVEDVEQSPIFIGTPALGIQLKVGVHAVQSTPIISRDGRPLGMFSTHFKNSHRPDDRELQLLDLLANQVADIIERKKAEEELKESEDLFRAFLESSSDVVYRMSPDWSEMYQLQGRNFIPNTFNRDETWMDKYIHPNDQQYVQEAINKAIHNKSIFELEHRVLQVDGSLGWTFSRAIPTLDTNGEIIEWFGTAKDITMHKKAEEALNQSQKMLQDIINGFPSPIFVKDIEGRFLTVNNKLEELLGVKNEELKGKTDYDIITKELADYYRINDQKVLEEGKTITFEEEADLIDGHHTFIANKFPIYDNNGKPYGIGSVSTDITELKKTEENLKESEERLRLSQTLGNVGIWDWNTITDELHFTPELEQLYGLIPGTIKTYQDWRQLTHPDDIEKIEAKRDEKIANHKPFDLEFRILHKSGQIHWLSAKGGAIYNDEGDILRVLGINTDITHRKKVEESLKESEERYHSLFDNNHAVMLLINPDNGNIIDANPAATHFYGYNYDELVKMNINNINVLCEEEIHDKMQKSVSFQKNNFLFKHQLASGEIRDVDVYSGKIVLGGEKLLYSIIHDVTDRMILQDKLKESNEDLERFAYVSSHDLQEPLRMVTSFTQLLERRYKGRLDEDADDYIGFIVDGAKRMKLLIDDLLMFSRLNTQPKENELVNLETVLDTVLLNLQVSIVENNVEITHDPLPSIYGDLSRKVQVFQNLISNAIKFNDKKIIKIHISAKKEGNERIFSVSDNGIGMDPKHLERIFIIFQRLHTREEYEGTGIGLAIIQKIIQQQNGRIWVESELGKGSTFYFTIPIN